MDSALSIIVAVVAILIFICFVLMIMSKKGNSSGKDDSNPKQKNRGAIIRECTKKLSHNPQNISALETLANLYFLEHSWDKAFPLYETLVGLSTHHTEINIAETNLRLGICRVKLGKSQEAIDNLLTALKIKPDSYEANYYLGLAFNKNGDFEKAIPVLKKSLILNPEAQGVNQSIGMAYYKQHKFSEAAPYLRRALNENPEDKETLYALADSMQESGFGEKALKIFIHLQADPKFGAQSCLSAGIIYTKMQQTDKAIQAFEIGTKLQNVPQDIYLELNYRLATSYFGVNKIASGLECLNRILAIVPTYKDATQLQARYKELNLNSNLQIYLSAGTNDFVALCRNLVKIFHKNSFVKIVDVSVVTDSVEILCEVENDKWEDKELFRFYRNSGSIGELYVRDFHAKIRETKCDIGYCITSGIFSEEAKKYIEGRPINLIEKAQLMKFLKALA